MATARVRITTLALLLSLALPAAPCPTGTPAQPAPATPCQKAKQPRLPDGPLTAKAGAPLLVEVRRELEDAEFPFFMKAEAVESPAGATLNATHEYHTLRLLADIPGHYRLRVRGIQHISAG